MLKLGVIFKNFNHFPIFDIMLPSKFLNNIFKPNYPANF